MHSNIPNRGYIYNCFIPTDYLFWFIVEGTSCFLRYSYVKFCIDLVLITENLVLVQNYYKEDDRGDAYLYHIWVN